PDRWIERTIALVGSFIRIDKCRFRLDGLRCLGWYADRQRVCSGGSNQAETGRTESGTKVTVRRNIHRYAERSGDRNQPVTGARASANRCHSINRGSGGLQHLKVVTDSKSNPLE